jgi:hypothetical protein
MDTSNTIILSVLILLFYLVLIWFLNRYLIYKGLGKKKIAPEELNQRTPILFGANLSLLIGVFLSFKTLYAFINYGISEQFDLVSALGLTGVIIVFNLTILGVSYVLMILVIKLILNVESLLIQSLVWVLLSSIVFLLVVELFNVLISVKSYTIL